MATTKPKITKRKAKAPKKKIPPKRKGGRPRRKAKRVPRLPRSEDNVGARPQPFDDSQLTLTVDNVDEYKKSNCQFYEKCMNHAAKKGWSQFHCNSCKIFKKDDNVDEQMRLALGRLNSGQNEPIY